jgi:pyruvate/2-oxoglutarate dehydrogenase complex dihydrolipoamide acyltransferase (E2) component
MRADKRDNDPIGDYTIEEPPFQRRFAMEVFAAVRPGHPMMALLELDVSLAQAAIARLQASGARVSLFAFVVRAIAVALAEHRALNVVRHGRRLVTFADVDVNIPVELETKEGHFPHQIVIRRASDKTPGEVYEEIEDARHRGQLTGNAGVEDRWALRAMRSLLLLPKPLRLWILRRLIKNPWMVKRRSGTTLVTSVAKFAAIPGFVIPFPGGPRATLFAVGSVVEKPTAREGQIAVRSVMSLTVVFDHDLVDGGPAARFIRRLQQLIETDSGLA